MAHPSLPPSPTRKGPGLDSSTLRIIRFGVFELDLQSRELRKRGIKVRLSDQPCQLLQLLLEHTGDVVTREELRQRLWPADTFVDFDLSLNSAVRKLREALGDSADHPTFIETLPRRGYRFIAPVERITAPDVVAPVAGSAPPRHRRRGRLFWTLVVLMLLPASALIVHRMLNSWNLFGAAAVPQILSIAVLPLENLTGDPTREYVVDGMTDVLIIELARVGGVSVISRSSSMRYKKTTKRVAEIARELGVDGIVEGAASLTGDRVRMTAQLVYAATERDVWAQSYDRDPSGVMDLQAEIARDIVTAVGNRDVSRSSPPAAHRPAVDPEAYDLYLKALQVGGRLNYEGFRAAVSYLEQSIARQPDFAMAYAALAQAWLQFLITGPMSPDEVLPKIESYARKAVALDDRLSSAHSALAEVRNTYADHAGARAEADRAVQVAPSSVDSLRVQARVLMRAGRTDEAIAAAERARKVDPLSINAIVAVASTLRAAGQRTRAIAELQKASSMDPLRPDVYYQLGATHVLNGDIKAAIASFEKAVTLSSQRNQRLRAYLAYAYGIDGRTRESRQILQDLVALRERQYVSSFGIALIHDALGEKEAALTALERASREHALELTMLDAYPPFRTLASDPRYQTLLQGDSGAPIPMR